MKKDCTELQLEVDQLNKSLHQRNQENERLERLTNEMMLDAKLKDGAIEELRHQVQEEQKKCAANTQSAPSKLVEKCVLLPFENKEVRHLNKIIGEHETTIKSLHKILKQMLEAGDCDVMIKNLLEENDN